MKVGLFFILMFILPVSAGVTGAPSSRDFGDEQTASSAMPSSTSTARLVFVSDFETGAIQRAIDTHDGWEKVNGNLPNATVVVGTEVQTPRSGKYCVQFNLDINNWNGVSDLQGTISRPRAQLKKAPDVYPYVQGVEYWIGLSTFHPADWQFDSNRDNQIVFWQMHGFRGPEGKSPPLALRLDGTTLSIVNRSGNRKDGSFRTETLWSGSMILNRWVDWIVRVRFEQTGTEGYVQVWRDGELIASKLNATTLYYTDTPDPISDQAYQLLSAYKSRWVTHFSSVNSHTLYYDSIRIAEGPNGKDLVDPANY